MICYRRKEWESIIGTPATKEDKWENRRWGSRSTDKWPAALGEKPRTCSYCGSVHPEDALRLIKDGWEINPSTKPYKWYLEPPGSFMHYKRLMAALGDEIKEKEAFDTPHYEVTPPMKFYAGHGSLDQLRELNSLLTLQRTNITEQ